MASLFATALITLSVDQLGKWSVLRLAPVAATTRGSPAPRIRIVMNRGGRFGLLQDGAVAAGSWAVAVAGLVGVVSLGPLFGHPLARVGLGAAVGGAAGNLLDRVLRGAVVDFIDVGFWPVFNVADVAIVVGVLLALSFIA